VSIKPAAPRAAAKVEKDPAATAVSTMSTNLTFSAMQREVTGRNARGADGANPEADPTMEARVTTTAINCMIGYSS
jgi:hypothetical protein